jgi:long-chain acyl-CoA synthetase
MMPAIFKLHYDLQYMLKLPFINREFVKWSEFLECGATDFHADEDMESGFSEELAIILHSGGTTGTPKGIMLTNGNVTALSVQSTDLVNCFGPGNKVLGILPVFHGFGLIFCVHNFLAAGGTVAIITRFKPELFELYLITHKPNIIAGVPTLFRGLISNIMPGIDLSFVQMMVCGGDNLSDELRENIISYFNKHNCLIEIREGYGLTESVAGVTITPPKCPSEGIGSVGIPYKDMLCQVVDTSTGNPVPVNTPGELLVSGPTVMKGYFNSNAENENIFSHKDGRKWLHTGDIVSMDENGFFHYIQRLKRMIITSGYNVYPSYIEGILHKNPYIEDAAVVGIPHPYKGEVAKAYIVLAPDIPLNEKLKQSIIRYCKKNLPFYSVPAKFLYVSALPRTAVGKTDYKQL